MTTTRTLQSWLDDLVVAAAVDRRAVSIAGLDDGIALQRVVCDRHDVTLNWLSAYSHLVQTERSHHFQHPDAGTLHQPGDLRPLVPESPWRVTKCSRPRCDAWIVWTSLTSGRRMPVDVVPVPDGPFVLTAAPADATVADRSEPIAMQLFDDAHVGDLERYVPHQRTCKTNHRPAGRRHR